MKISKGTGEYPWGFRIQFSKPIVVTEVDTSKWIPDFGVTGSFAVFELRCLFTMAASCKAEQNSPKKYPLFEH